MLVIENSETLGLLRCISKRRNKLDKGHDCVSAKVSRPRRLRVLRSIRNLVVFASPFGNSSQKPFLGEPIECDLNSVEIAGIGLLKLLMSFRRGVRLTEKAFLLQSQDVIRKCIVRSSSSLTFLLALKPGVCGHTNQLERVICESP